MGHPLSDRRIKVKRWPFSGFFVCPAAVIVMSAKFSLKDFPPHQITLQHGDTLPLHLAERGTHLGNGLWLRELRRLDEKGHQTSILSTDYRSDITTAAAAMFARWHQENFFKATPPSHPTQRPPARPTHPSTTNRAQTLHRHH